MDPSACGLLGCDIIGGQGNVDAIVGSTGGLIRLGFSLIFVVIIVIGIAMIVKAAFTIIRSEGDSSKIEEGYKTLKGVWIGVGLIFVGIIGVVVVLAFFNAEVVDTNPEVPPGVVLPTI